MLKFKLYMDKDLEEVWLKEMSSKGWGFKKFFLGFYSFEKCEPGEYNYQIDLLDNWNGDKDEFSSFMEDIGIEVISQWYRWIYIRKKAIDGPLEMYTDTESKIAQYSRINKFFRLALVIEIACFTIELIGAIRTGSLMIWSFVALLGIMGLSFLRIIWKCRGKIELLKGLNN